MFDQYIYRLITAEEDIRCTTRSVLRDFAADGVVYLELRTTPRAIAATCLTKADYVNIVLSEMEAFNTSQDALHSFLILSIDRKISAEEAISVVELALANRSRGVVGIDLCGNPMKGDVSIFKEAFARAKEVGLKITLHFGEVPASGTVEELETLLSFIPDRLGHVIHVPPEVQQEIERRGLGLELCLSCNVLAGLTQGGYAEHHFGMWKTRSCPIALSVSMPPL